MSRRIKIGIGIVVIIVILISALVIVQQRDSVERQLGTAKNYIEDGNYEQAIMIYEAIIEIDEANIGARMGLSSAYMGTGDSDKAVEQLVKVIEIDDQYGYAYIEYVEILIELEMYDEAIAILEKGYS